MARQNLTPSTAAYVARVPNSIVWLGDSVTGKGGDITGDTVFDPQGFWCWAQDFLGHRFWTIKNAGNAGETSTQILARVQSDVIANNPGWCHILAGTNDIGAGNVAVSTVTANLTAMFDQLTAAGIRIIVGTIPPRNTYTGTMLADTVSLNNWIRNQAKVYRNLIVVDYFSVLTDAGTTGHYAANMTADGMHPSFQGAAAMGSLLANTLGSLVPPASFLSNFEGDTSNLIAAGRFNTGGSGSAPTGWNAVFSNGPPTYSKTARTDNVPGSWQTLALPATCGGGILKNAVSIPAVGHVVFACVEYSLSSLVADTTNQFYLLLSALDAGAATISSTADLNPVLAQAYPLWSRSGVLRTPPLVIPTGTVTLQMNITMKGQGTYNLDRAGIFDATASGINA